MKLAKECRRILASGARCHALAVTGTPYCYFHQAVRSFDQENRKRHRSIVVPKIEDRAAIHITLMSVLDAIGSGKMDPVRGRIYLNGLKLAMNNLGANNNQLASTESVTNPVCPDGGEFLAPEDVEILDPLPTNELICSEPLSLPLSNSATDEPDNQQTLDISAAAEPDTPLPAYGAHEWQFAEPEPSDDELRQQKYIARTVRYLARDLNAVYPFRTPEDRRALSAQLHAEYFTRFVAHTPDPLPCTVASRYLASLLS